jgi:hypothetical protein
MKPKNEDNVFQVFMMMAVNSMFVNKAVGWKWDPCMKALMEEKFAGRDAVSFKHLTKDQMETNLVFLVTS